MFVYLTEKDIDKIVELQNLVYKDLKDDEKAFLLPKDKFLISQHFSKGHKVFGHYSNGKLVAQAFIVNPSAKNPETGMVDMPDIKDIGGGGVSVLQGVVVHPDCQGQKIGGKLINYWVESSAGQGKTTALAEATTQNFKSYGAFLKAGLVLDSMGVDPADGTVVFNMKGNPVKMALKKTFNECAAAKCSIDAEEKCFSVPVNDIKSLKQAFNDNYVGTHWNKKSKTIQFHKRNNPHLAI